MARPKTKGCVSEALIQEIGAQILAEAQSAEKQIADRHPWETRLLNWCMQDPQLKAQIFRFIDVFPALTDARDVVNHLKEYFPSSGMRLPKEIRIGLALTKPSLITAPLIQKTSRWLHSRMAKFFIGADTIEEAMTQIETLEKRGISVSIDLLGELTTSEAEAERYAGQYQKLFDLLSARADSDRKQSASIKLTALDPRFDPIDAEGTRARVSKRLIPLLERAARQKILVFIDMEHYAVRDLTLKIIEETLREHPDFIPHTGLVLQAYLTDARETAEQVLAWAEKLPHPLTVRLVRGAYWDTEIMHAQELNWPVPVYLKKAQTDLAYEEIAAMFLSRFPKIRLAVATHNIRSIAFAMAFGRERKLEDKDIEFQLLYGLGEPLESAILAQGFPVRLYMPVGDPLPGMSYLVRRLLENVSQQSFLRQSFWEHAPAEALLKAPVPGAVTKDRIIKRIASPLTGLAMTYESTSGFQNEPLLNFSEEPARGKFQETVDAFRNQLGVKIPLLIDGEEVSGTRKALSTNPSRSSEIVAEYVCAGKEQVERAFHAAHASESHWREVPVEERAALLRRTAAILRARRMEIAAMEIYEVGKPWRDADADVCEAIDFLEFYADEALKLFQPSDTQSLSHESNFTVPRGRGTTVVIAPWNFPLAILTGMSSAALAAGNPVILKPAAQSSLVGWQLALAYREAGLPKDVMHFLTGSGAELGPALAEDPRVAMIAFTGSRGVGLEIAKRAAASNEHSSAIKKVITELGGKNAIIVDASADFDQAIPAVLESAFGYGGQKCSAASRLIVLEPVARPFLKRLVEAASTMTVGDPVLAETRVGPLINGEAAQRLRLAYDEARKNGKVLYRAELGALSDQGYFVPPVIAGNLPAKSPLLRQELFGPFLIVSIAKTFEDALAIANDSEYALTGGVFSRTPSHIEHAKRSFDVGNLYINRKITGAVVGRQPFGGHRMSGGGSKAGGRDYLREFVNFKTVSENRMRHGFAPLNADA